MVTPKSKGKRRKTTIIAFLPALLIIFFIGWCLYCIGDQKRPDKIKRQPVKKDNIRDNVTIMPIVYEETQEIINK